MLIRHDPFFRDVDRLAASLTRGQPNDRAIPLRAVRTAEAVVVSFDVPGVPPEDIELTVDRNVLAVRATRPDRDPPDADVLIDERGAERLAREVTLSDTLDVERISATYEDGVLSVHLPLSRRASPRRVPVSGGTHRSQLIRTDAEGTAPAAQPPPPGEQANPAPTS